MKMILRLIVAITLTLILMGCTNATQTVSTYPDTSLKNKQKLVINKFTNDDALAVFKSYKEFDTYEITDYVFVNDDKIPKLKAIISFYDKKITIVVIWLLFTVIQVMKYALQLMKKRM